MFVLLGLLTLLFAPRGVNQILNRLLTGSDMARIYDDLTKLIGNTPLLRVSRMGRDLPGEILMKLEAFNP